MTVVQREFRRLPSVDGYLFELVELATEFRVERLRRERGELVGELSVSCGLPGVRGDALVSVADFNLSSARARQERARILAERSGLNGEMDWSGFLEDLCQRTIAAERTGEPAVLLRDLPRPEAGDVIDVDAGVRLLARHPVIVFGDGGDAKSYLGLYWAGRLALAGRRVLFADWEFAGEDHRDRLERLFGDEMPDVLYVRAERPMTAEADRLARIIREEAIDYLIADSIAFASDGPPEAAEVAAAYFRAVRRLRVGSLHIAHTTKSENGDQKPFGSAFWHNSARATWYVKRSAETADEHCIDIGLFQRKANLGPLAPAVGYRITFGAERTTFERTDVANVVDLAARLSVRQRMASILRGGSMTMVEIAGELDEPLNTIVQTVKRGENKVFVRVPGPDGVFRIGLLERRDA